jgi:hypothetical protein
MALKTPRRNLFETTSAWAVAQCAIRQQYARLSKSVRAFFPLDDYSMTFRRLECLRETRSANKGRGSRGVSGLARCGAEAGARVVCGVSMKFLNVTHGSA